MSDQSVLIGTYPVGAAPAFIARCIGRSTGRLADPTGIKFITRNPAGTETVYVYGVASEITKTADGIYQFAIPQFTASHVGTWSLRTNASGVLVGAREVTFEVLATAFTTPLP